MGQITDILDYFFESPVRHLVEQDCKNNRGGKTPKQAIKTNKQGIPYQFPKVGVQNKFLKMFKPYPGTAHNTPDNIVVLKGNQNSIHGGIMKNKIIYQGNKKNNIKVFAFFDLPPRLRLSENI
jgi:hypothetical protein